MALLIDRNAPETPPLLAGPRAELLRIARGLRQRLPQADLVVLDGPAELPVPPPHRQEHRPDTPA